MTMYTARNRIKRGIINIYHSLSLDKLRMFSGGFDKQINDAIKQFGGDSKLTPQELKSDIKKCYYRHLTRPDEYFLFGFEGKDESYRSAFLSDNLRVRYLLKTISEEKYVNELCDKFNFYKMTSKFFKRRVIQVGGTRTCSLKEFINFSEGCKKAFVKPISSTFGKGAHIVEFPSNTKEIEQIYIKYSQNGGGEWIFEDLINQCRETSLWNPTSVNTVRMPCILSGGEFHVLNPFLRTGRKGQVIDNGGSGGVFACIDETTGIVSSDGIDEQNVAYTHHPDSEIEFKGWEVPKYKELLSLAETIFRTCLPEHKYIGFDFALTDDGWVLIEGNWGQFVGQYASKRGVRQKFLKYLRNNE